MTVSKFDSRGKNIKREEKDNNYTYFSPEVDFKCGKILPRKMKTFIMHFAKI